MTVVPLHTEKLEAVTLPELMRPEEFCRHLADTYNLPKPPSVRWLRELYLKRGMPSRTILKRYKMIPVEPATKWLRSEGYL